MREAHPRRWAVDSQRLFARRRPRLLRIIAIIAISRSGLGTGTRTRTWTRTGRYVTGSRARMGIRRGGSVEGMGIGMAIGRVNGLAEEGIVENGRSKGVAVIGGGARAGAGIVVVGWQQKGALGDEE